MNTKTNTTTSAATRDAFLCSLYINIYRSKHIHTITPPYIVHLLTVSGLWVYRLICGLCTQTDVISEGKHRAGDSTTNWQQRGCHWVEDEHCSHVISLERERDRERGGLSKKREGKRGEREGGVKLKWKLEKSACKLKAHKQSRMCKYMHIYA